MNIWPILLPVTILLAGFILYNIAAIAPYYWKRWQEARWSSRKRLSMRQAQQYWDAGDQEDALWIVRQVLTELGIPVAHLSDDELLTGVGLLGDLSTAVATAGVSAEEVAKAIWALAAALQDEDEA